MKLYAVMRRSIARSDQIEELTSRSVDTSDRVRKIRSYVLAEPGGRIGTICLYEAINAEALYEHGRISDLPVDEVVRVAAVIQ